MIEHITMIMLATGFFGAVTGIIGSWLLLEQKSLFADTIAHATFPGITLIFLITHNQSPIIFMAAALLGCLIAAFLTKSLKQNTTLKKDTVLGVILAASFGIGSMLLSKIQQLNIINSNLITKYFLGNAATIMQEDCLIIIIISLLSLLTTLIYKRQYCIIIFDSTFSKITQISRQYISKIMLVITTLTITTGLQIVGIILMSSLLINPAAAAYQWTKRLTNMMILAALFGFASTSTGIYISSKLYHVPPGPIIIIIATTITLLSILLSPQGILTTWYTDKVQKKELSYVQLLSRFLLFNEFKTDPFYAHDLITLKMIGKEIPTHKLLELEQHGFITTPKKNFWALTAKGLCLLKKQKDIHT
ncbi:metal ABC transporter permease [Candidatus Dependentiae bacterium]|nr:metal ABC transporter permease [Candidatus Dependentiae bacterium]